MKHLIFAILFCLPIALSGQIVKGMSIMAFDSLPNVDPFLPNGTEIAYSLTLKKFYGWDTSTDEWVELTSQSEVSTVNTAKIYCPSHGLNLSSFTGEIIAIRDGCNLANAQAADSLQTRYVVATPHADTLEIQGSGLVQKTAHGLTEGQVYYLQDSPNGESGVSAGTVESKTFVVMNEDYLQLVDPSNFSGANSFIPVINVPAAALSFYGTDTKAVEDTVMQNIAEVYAAANAIVPGSFLITTNSSISDNQIYRANPDGSSVPSHSWHWNGEKVTRVYVLPISISMRDTLYGGAGTLPLDTILPSGNFPNDTEVAQWYEDNFINNGLRLPNGSIVYWNDLQWTIIDDLSSENPDSWERLIKATVHVEDSARIVQDSILVYYQNGIEIGRDTIRGAGGGGGGGGGSTSPADDNGAVQYNNGGSFGGDDTNFFWDDTNNRLGIGSQTPNEALDVSGNIQSSGLFLAADGSASNPSTTNTGDEDTGGYYPAEDQYAISTGGVQRFSISDTGLVSIVNSGELEIVGPSGAGSTEVLRLYRGGGWGGGAVSVYRSGLDHGFIFGGFGAAPTKSDVFTMDFYNGKIGIHETDPSASLQINATEGTGDLRIAYDASNYVTFTTNSSGDAIIDPTSDYMQFGGQIDVLGPAGATDDVLFSTTKSGGYGQTYFRQYYDSFSEQGLRLSYNTSGNYDFTFQLENSPKLGIGIQSPAEALDVSGNIQATGTIVVGDGSAAGPGYSNYDDPDTGVFFGAADELDFSTGGTERMNIGSTGIITANNDIIVTNGTNTNEIEHNRLTITNGSSSDFVILTPEAISVDNSTDNVDPSESQVSGSYIYTKQREPSGSTGAAIGAFNTGDPDPVLKLVKGSMGTSFYNTDVIGADTVLGVIKFIGQDESGNMLLSSEGRQGTGASIQAVSTEAFSTTAHGAKLEFYTVDNTTTTLDLRMTIDEDGTVIITNTIWLNAGKTLGIFTGSGSPEGAVTADIGSTYHRTDGGTGTGFYVKESNSGGSTGWVAK